MNQDKHTICPACGNQATSVSRQKYYGYTLMVCQSCHCEFCFPFKAPDIDFYTNATDVASNSRHNKLDPWSKAHPTNDSALFQGQSEGKTLLDIGCGNGAFVAFADSKGYTCSGIDLDANSLEAARRRTYKHTTLSLSTLKDFIAVHPQQQFDVVSMFEVFEHLDNPKETIDLIKQILKPDGYFIGTLPNENRFFAKSYNLNFALPPYHLTYWRKESWKHYLENFNGMKARLVENNVYYGYLSDLIFSKMTTRFRIENNKYLLLPIKAVFKLTSAVESLVEKIGNKSSSFYFEIQK